MANDIGIRIGLEGIAAYQQGLNQIDNQTSKTLGGVSSTVDSSANSFRNLAQQLPGVGTALTFLSNPLGAALASATALTATFTSFVRTASGFESQLATVGALLGVDNTTEAFAALNEEAKRLGANTEFSASQAAQAMEFLARAGFDAQETIAGTEQTLSLATVGALDLARAADIATDTLSQFNKPVEELGSVVDILAKTTVTSNTNVTQLADALNYLGPTANALGVSLEESAAAIGILSSSGLKGSLATRALGTSLVNLTKPTAAAAAAMEQYNISAFQDGNFVGLAGLVKQLETAFAGLSDEARQAAIANIFGAEAVQEVNILLSKGSKALSDYTAEIAEAGAQGGEFAKGIREIKLDTFEGSILSLKSAWEAFKIELTDGSLPILKEITYGLADLLRGIVDVVGQIPSFEQLSDVFADNAEFIGIAAGALLVWNSTAILAAAQSIPGLITSVLASVKAFAAQAASTNIAIAAQALYITGSQLLRGSITAATAAQRIFNVVFNANPIALAGTAIIAVATAFAIFSDETEAATRATDRFAESRGKINESYAQERVQLDKLFAPLKSNTASANEKRAAIEKINQTYGEYLPNLLSEKSSVEDIAAAYRAANEAILDGIINRAIEQEATKLFEARLQIAQDQKKAQAELNQLTAIELQTLEESNRALGLNQELLDSLGTEAGFGIKGAEKNFRDFVSTTKEIREEILNAFEGIDLSGILSTGGNDDPTKTVRESVKSLRDELADLGISLSALNRFDELTGLAQAIPLSSIEDSAEKAKAAIVSVAIEPGTPISQLEEQLSNIKKALELIDPESAGFEYLAQQAGILESRINRVNAELDRLSDGGPRQPIVFPVELSEDNILNQVETLDPPPITVPVDVVVPNQGAFASLAEAAQALGVDVEFLNQRFGNTGELLELMDSKAFKFFERMGIGLPEAIDLTEFLKEALRELGKFALNELGNDVEAFGYALGQAIANPIETVDVMQAKLDAVRKALETAPEGSGLQASLQQQAEALEQQLGGVQALRDELGAVNAAMRNLPSDSPAFRALEGQAESLENQLSLLEGTTSRFAGAFDTFVQELLNTILVAVPKMLGLFLLQGAVVASWPAGIPFAVAGLALLGLSALAKGLLEKAAAQDPSLDLGTFDPGSVSSNLTGGFSGPSLATGQADTQTAVGLSDYANTAQAATNITIQFDSEDVTEQFSIFFQRERELTGG